MLLVASIVVKKVYINSLEMWFVLLVAGGALLAVVLVKSGALTIPRGHLDKDFKSTMDYVFCKPIVQIVIYNYVYSVYYIVMKELAFIVWLICLLCNYENSATV